MADPSSSDRNGSPFFRFCAWSLSGLVIVGLVLALVLAVLSTTRISAPDWMRDRISQEINARLQTASIEVGDVTVGLDRMVPRLGLRHVEMRDGAGEQLLQLGDVQVDFGLNALLRGDVAPASVAVSGVQLRVRRFETGSVGLSLETAETGAAPVAEYRGVRLGIHDATVEMDAWLNHPQLRGLNEVLVDNVTLRYEDERAGQVWTADGARLSLARSGDDLRLRGDAALLGGGASVATIEMNYSRSVGATTSELGITFKDMPARDIAGQSPALAWLSALDAPISGSLRAEVDESGDAALGPLHATLQIGEGALRPLGGARPVAFNNARAYFTYHPDAQTIEFTEVLVDSGWVRAEANGLATLDGMDDGWPTALGAKFEIAQVVINPSDVYPEPVMLERAHLDMALTLEPLVIDLHSLQLFDRDEVLSVMGKASAAAEGWNVAVSGDMAGIMPDRLLELWPNTLAPKAHQWIAKNVIRTELSDIRFDVQTEPGERPSVFLGFNFSDFHARFMRDVPPIEAAYGQASLQNTRFVISAEGGHITAKEGGQLDIAGTRFIIPNTGVKRTPAEVELVASAPITAALSFLDERPFGYISRAGLPIDLAEGTAEAAGTLYLRMVDKLDVRDVKFELAGALTDVVTDKLLDGRVLSAPQLSLNTSHEGLKLEGPGFVGEVPFDGQYAMSFAPDPDPATAMGTVNGTIEISDRFLEEFGISLPPGSFSGQGRAAVEIDLARASPAALRLQSDLEGIALRIDALSWEKPAATPARMQVAGRLGSPPDIDLIEIDAPGLKATGAISLTSDGAMERALFQRVEAEDWLDATVELVGRGRDAPPQVRILGGQVDLQRAELAKNKTSDNAGPLSIQLDQLTLSETLVITNFRAEITNAGGLSGPFSGTLNGRDTITGQMIPQNGRSAFQVRSENAGAFFEALGLLRNGRNGAVDLSLVPGTGEGVWEGTLSARGGMRLKDAPTMAALLNAVTVVGLLEQLGGEGIHFEAVDARFQISPERLTLYSMSATGAALGISMDGYYYPSAKQMDLQGVISPLYLFNAVGGFVSRQGEGLFGFNYTLRGPSSNPEVSVNPLSALTPGMFRDIFRRAPPQRNASGLDEGDVQASDDGTAKQQGIGPKSDVNHDR